MIGSDQKRYVYWCRNCGVPLLQPVCENCGTLGTKMVNDLRPIFEEEKVFIENHIGETLPNDTRLLWMRQWTIWFDGSRYMRLSANKGLKILNRYPIEDSARAAMDSWSELLWRANFSTLEALEREATTFIQRVSKQYPDHMPIVSFSGGKDSTLVSHLVRKALATEEVTHIFADTTIEFPDTYQYIKEFHEAHTGIPFISERASTEWYNMCEVMGIPSRIFPWCCTVFKASPISTMLYKLKESNGGMRLLNFEGIRRAESNKRRLRPRINSNSKLRNQVSVEPIIDWKSIEVWLYILGQGIPFNQAYRKGFSRVGCLYCPHHPHSTETYLSFHFPQHITDWKAFVIKQAEKLGKDDPLEYWESEAWKIRVGEGRGKSSAYVRKVPCLKNTSAMHFLLDRELVDGFVDRFKPFGKIEEFHDDVGEGFIVKEAITGAPQFMIKRVKNIELLHRESKIDPSWELGNEFLCVDLLTTKGHYRLLQAIERQIRKSQACELCGACQGLCPQGAIRVDGRYAIDEERCNHCGACIRTKPLQSSCIAVEAKRRF